MPSVHFFHHLEQNEKEAEEQETIPEDNEEKEEKPNTFPRDAWY